MVHFKQSKTGLERLLSPETGLLSEIFLLSLQMYGCGNPKMSVWWRGFGEKRGGRGGI